MSYSTDDNAGFTLLELLVVLAIAALLLTLTGPGFSAFSQSTNFSRLSHELTTSLHQARDRSDREGRIIRLSLSPGVRKLEINGETIFSWPEQTRLLLITDDDEAHDQGAILFFPAAGSSGARLRLISEQSNRVQQQDITINWLTGGIQHVSL